MNWSFIVYSIDVLDFIKGISLASLFCSSMYLFIVLIGSYCTSTTWENVQIEELARKDKGYLYEEHKVSYLKWKKHEGKVKKKLIITVVCTALLLIMVPSKSTSYKMITAQVGQNVLTSGDFESILGKSTQAITTTLDKYIDKTKEETKSE